MDYELRKKSIGASEIGKLMSGDHQAIHDLWMLKTGRTDDVNLSDPEQCDNWFQVRLGTHTESINIQARIDTQPEFDWVSNDKPLTHGKYPFISATPDAYAIIDGYTAVVDAKHTHNFNGAYADKEDRMLNTYWWQMQQQMLVRGVPKAIISPIYGTQLGDLIFLDANPFDQELIIEKASWFWDLVTRDVEPEVIDQEPVTPSIPSEYRQVKFDTTNYSADVEELAKVWVENKPKEKLYKDADKAIKAFIPDDVNLAEGHGIKVTRTKPSKTRPNGSLSIKVSSE